MSQRDRFRALAAQRGFTADEIEHWLKAVRLYVSLRSGVHPISDRDDVSWPGKRAGRIGGLPRLPPGVPWPTGAWPDNGVNNDNLPAGPPWPTGPWPDDESRSPIPYFGSVDCAALPLEIDVIYPADGTLLFFSDNGLPHVGGRMLYVPAGVETIETPPPDEDLTVLPEQDLYAVPRWGWPSWLDGDDWSRGEVSHLEPEVVEFHSRVPRQFEMFEIAGEVWPEAGYSDKAIDMGDYNYAPQYSPEYWITLDQLRVEGNYRSQGEFWEQEKGAEEIVYEREWQLRLKQEWVTLGAFEIPEMETFYACFIIHRNDLANCKFDDVRHFLMH